MTTCDLCSGPVKADGQATEHTVLCGRCLERLVARERENNSAPSVAATPAVGYNKGAGE